MRKILSAAIGLLLVFTACDFSVNKDVRVPDGSRRSRGARSVNGNVRVGSDCRVQGECMSVNGSIQIGKRSMVRGLKSVNGGISMAEGAVVNRKVEIVNGSLEMEPGSVVKRGIKAVNGPVRLDSALVQGGIILYNGDVYLNHGSRIEGGIMIKRSKNIHSDQEHPQVIEINNGSVVEGDIRVNNPDYKVDVILINGGRVIGSLENVNLIEK